jgi:hypothetical protein
MFEGGIKKPLPEPPITIRFHERTGKEPVLGTYRQI